MNIGFIGLGIMGTPMSKNIIKKRKDVKMFVYDLNPAACKELEKMGATAVSSVELLLEEADLTFTMVPTGKDVENLYAKLLPKVRANKLLVDMSTIEPAVSKNIAQKVRAAGGIMLDAPVVKSQQAAIDGTLGIYVGGDKASYEKIKAYLDCMGSNTIYLGANGSGLAMKICHNMLVGQIQNGVNEMLSLAQAQGISVSQFKEAVNYGGGSNFYLDSKADNIDKNEFKVAFSVKNMHKDVFIAKSLAEESGLKLPAVDLVAAVYEEALKAQLGDLDFSATYKIVSK